MKNGTQMHTMFTPIRKMDEELQIVYGEVYAPDVPDAQGDFMTSVEVRKMAHAFLLKGNMRKVDTQHDNKENGSGVVESFIARDGDPDFLSGAWVVGIHVPDATLWAKVKSGELNGFSFEGMVQSAKRLIALEVPEDFTGPTDMAEGHNHVYVVKLGDSGEFLGGWTVADDSGHQHEIKRATVTEPPVGNPDGHRHRFSFTDGMV
jgi:hypothetical protein